MKRSRDNNNNTDPNSKLNTAKKQKTRIKAIKSTASCIMYTSGAAHYKASFTMLFKHLMMTFDEDGGGYFYLFDPSTTEHAHDIIKKLDETHKEGHDDLHNLEYPESFVKLTQHIALFCAMCETTTDDNLSDEKIKDNLEFLKEAFGEEFTIDWLGKWEKIEEKDISKSPVIPHIYPSWC